MVRVPQIRRCPRPDQLSRPLRSGRGTRQLPELTTLGGDGSLGDVDRDTRTWSS